MTASKKIPDSLNGVRQAASWMARSGIQNRSKDATFAGGVAGWYDCEAGDYPYLYSEITGYAATTFAFLKSIFRDASYASKARAAGGWILRNAMTPAGAVRTRLYLRSGAADENYSFEHGRIFSFDASMVGYGLLQLYRSVKDARYLDASRKIAAFLRGPFQRGDLVYPYFDLSTGRCGEDFEKWSNQTGAFHGKLALFFIDLWRATSDALHRRNAERMLEAIRVEQKPDGRFVTNRADDSTLLHPHAYALEGLLYGAHFLKKSKLKKAAAKGFEWMLRATKDDGSVAAFWDGRRFAEEIRSDIVAQTLRIGSILCAMKQLDRRSRGHLDRIAAYLLGLQCTEGRQSGGFRYHPMGNGPSTHLNSWCTMFALQALWMYERFVRQNRALEIGCLV